MADDDKPLADRILDKVFDHEGRIKTVESGVRDIKGSLAMGVDRMHATDRRVDGLELGMRELGRDIREDNRAANEGIRLEVAKLGRTLPWWVRSGIGAAAGLAVALLAFVGRTVWDQRTEQATQAEHIHQIQDSAARTEAALKAMADIIRGVTPGKATP